MVNGDKDENPYLSIVICSRNDNHGDNMLRRMQVSLNGWLEQLEKYRIESELILVEWNPPAGKPLLKDVIQWPSGLKYCSVRIIEVPFRIHRRYKYHNKIPIAVAVAINTGIRRARGKFVLPGAIDSLFPDELMSYIALKSLDAGVMFRVNRCDVNENVVNYKTLSEQLDFCRENIITVYSHVPTAFNKKDMPDLHLFACGDFQLMSRYYWHLLHGYREKDIVPSHCDGLLSYASYVAGVREVVLKTPLRVYHIQHKRGRGSGHGTKVDNVPLAKWMSLPFMPRAISFKLISLYRKYIGETTKVYVNGIPSITWGEFLRFCEDIVAGKRSYILNDDTWGLAGEDLKETLISLAEWDN